MPDLGKYLTELPEALTLDDDDILYTVVGSGTTTSKKVKKSTILSADRTARATAEGTIVANFASPYSTTTQYAVGDYCIKDLILYKCTSLTSGTWDSTKWVATTVEDAMDITQLPEATSYTDGMYYAVASASGGTEKINAETPSLTDIDILDIERKKTVNLINSNYLKGETISDYITNINIHEGECLIFPIPFNLEVGRPYTMTLSLDGVIQTNSLVWRWLGESYDTIGDSYYFSVNNSQYNNNVKYVCIYAYNSDSLSEINGKVIDFVELRTTTDATADPTGEYPYINGYKSKRLDSINQNLNNLLSGNGYGIKIKNDGTCERIGLAEGKQNNYKIGDNFVNDGVNDFDNIYPWNEIKICNVNYNDLNDPILTYENDPLFKRDGTNGDVVVEIPKYYTKRFIDADGNDNILISGCVADGYEIEPAFYDEATGKILDKIYVGAYLTETGLSSLNSRSGAFPESNVSKNSIKERDGDMYDFVTLLAIQKLMIIEFGLVNLSPIFGGFSNLPWSSSCRANESKTNTNSAEFKGDGRLANINVGTTITISTQFGQIQNRTITAISEDTIIGGGHYRTVTFDGSPVDIINDTTLLYCTGQKTGFTDSIDYHTGRTNLNSGNTLSNQFKYRGIEGIWGTLGEMMDGVYIKNLKLYWSNSKSQYNDISLYHRLNFPIPLQNTYTNSQNPKPPQIKKMGLDFRNPLIMIPSELAAINDNYYHDLMFTISTIGPDGQEYPVDTEFMGISSMAWDGSNDNGLFTIRFWQTDQEISWLYGTRRIYRYLTVD